MRLTWFGHSAFRLDFDGAVILIDPFLNGNPSFTGNFDAAIAGATHILVTHGHGDHVGDTVAIAKQTGATVVTNYDLGMWLLSQGIPALEPMYTGGTIDLGAFKVSMVRADHAAAMVEGGVGFPLGSANGLIVKPPSGPVVYHMGDTDIFGDMGLIAELHTPEIGIVPIGDRFTMGADTAALAVKRYFNFKAVIPCHFGTFPIVDANADRFVAAMAGHATRVLLPAKGEATAL